MESLNKEIAPAVVYPEKVLQFGTGVLLRGLPDFFIEKANRKGVFGGSILVVKSTANGGTDHFLAQDNRYTIHIKGLEKGQEVSETLVVSAINRVVSAQHDWSEILEAASDPALQIVISNTTEVGIVLDEHDRLSAAPPQTFPGKLTAFLYRRYEAFEGDEAKGLVILPTELIDKNGQQLKDIVLQLARISNLPPAFVEWLATANTFCNTLVDRIVPGKLPQADQLRAEAESGYRDSLAIMAEPFRLWAIETADERVKNILSFAEADPGVVLTPDITKFKELKLRLLNGTHTFSCALAMLGGWPTVKEAMQDDVFARFVKNLMTLEIIPSLSAVAIGEAEARVFADSVIDRFGNPFLNHQWKSISLNYTAKMEMRNVATIQRYTQVKLETPAYMALGFAAYLLLMRDAQLDDPNAGEIKQAWKHADINSVVDAALGQSAVWKTDLRTHEAFAQSVKRQLACLLENGVPDTIKSIVEA